MNEKINLDKLLDYKTLYKNIVDKAQISGDQLRGLCPVHQEKTPSFSVDLKTGKCHCFSCGFDGNYTSLYAHIHGLDTNEAFKQICKENHIDLNQDQQPAKPKEPARYNLETYATKKKLPLSFLEQFFNLSTHTYKDGGQAVKIPYYDLEGKVSAIRFRHDPKSDRRFTWSKGAKTCLYGLNFFESIKESGSVILVEGESDTQTLTFLGFNALGVPGASTFQSSEANLLQDLKIYIHVENDAGGELFLNKTREILKKADFKGGVFRFSCADLGIKDPSGLYLRDGAEKAAQEITDLLKNAAIVDLEEPEQVPESITNAPINLRIPAGYIVDDSGIWKESAKEGGDLSLVIKTPIMIAKRLIAYDSEEEKIQILFKRDFKLIGGVFDRKTVFNNTNIFELTSLGATISSSNAKAVVTYLTQLEEANLDRIPVAFSSKTLGWLPNGEFLPYFTTNTVLDAHGSLSQWAGACTTKGDLTKWVDLIAPHRVRYRFRFILAGSFTAPLLKTLRCRSFLIYNWASSRGGKTAALKSALSVWGDPERMMISFNATSVAFERMASFFCDLPLGIDERQQASANQNGLESLFYMLSNGQSKGRGTRDGGIQEINTWRTVALSTGEEPIAQDNTMTGVTTRTIEIVGAPFDKEAEAAEVHRSICENFGNAGKVFIKYLMETDPQEFIKLYEEFQNKIKEFAGDRNGSHISLLAAVATADIVASKLIFNETDTEAKEHAVAMIQDIVKDMQVEELPDVNISACSYLLDYFQANESRLFSDDVPGQRAGWTDPVGMSYGSDVRSILWIPSMLKNALTEGGFNYRKTIKYLRDNGLIKIDAGGKNSTVIKRGGKLIRVIKMNKEALEKMLNKENPVEEEDLPF